MEKKSRRYKKIEEAEGVEITPKQESPSAPKTKGKSHTVASGETLSHIALNYYGAAAKEKWMIIYEANKNVIGDDPNFIRTGMELFIPDIEK